MSSEAESSGLAFEARPFGQVMTLGEVSCHGPGSFVLGDWTTTAVKGFSSVVSIQRPTFDDPQAKPMT